MKNLLSKGSAFKFIILLGVILLFVGLGFPKSHDIAGVGIAMLALAVGLKYFTRRPA